MQSLHFSRMCLALKTVPNSSKERLPCLCWTTSTQSAYELVSQILLLQCSPNTDRHAVVEKSRDHKSKGVGSIQLPSLYVVKEDGDPSLKLWAQTLLIEDRADQGESIVQWISKLREKVCTSPEDVPLILSTWPD
jgi:hypothetical protein